MAVVVRVRIQTPWPIDATVRRHSTRRSGASARDETWTADGTEAAMNTSYMDSAAESYVADSLDDKDRAIAKAKAIRCRTRTPKRAPRPRRAAPSRYAGASPPTTSRPARSSWPRRGSPRSMTCTTPAGDGTGPSSSWEGNGHVHSSMHCKTCRQTTRFAWMTDYSGADEEKIFAVNRPGFSAATLRARALG